MTQVLLYLPVIHAGYESLLREHARDAQVLLVGDSFAEQFPVMGKEIRALAPERAADYLRGADVATHVRVVETSDLPAAVHSPTLIVPDEDITRGIVEAYRLAERAHIQWHRSFLRWDRSWSQAGRPPEWDGQVSAQVYAQQMQALAQQQAERSSDWWRQVGALACRDGQVLAVAHNHHHPSEYSPYMDGDPRNSFTRGVAMELTTALHAEAALVADAAQHGLSLAGADLHVTTFPCPTCARLVAAAGFARCYFGGGYSVLAGEQVLRAAGVELVFVEPPTPDS